MACLSRSCANVTAQQTKLLYSISLARRGNSILRDSSLNPSVSLITFYGPALYSTFNVPTVKGAFSDVRHQ